MEVKGRIININGPIVKAEGLREAGMLDVVEVGNEGLFGEIIRNEGNIATIQVYEDNSGMKPGEPVISHRRPLSVELGPGLIGSIYDGIQRPLIELEKLSGAFIKRGEKTNALSTKKKWYFTPLVDKGIKINPGMSIGEVQETGLIKTKVLVPPEVEGELTFINKEGEYTINDVIYKIKTKNGIKEFTLSNFWPVRIPRPYKEKLGMETPLITGLRVIDTFFPISKGGTAAIPGGFGTGKTMTQHSLAKWSDADIIVYIGCGERGNEMTDVLNEFPKLVDPKSGRPLMERTILIANTSNMPVAAREVSIYTGVTIAEYYRDMGYDVAIMADSTSRWAEALRELSGRLEEMPAEEGFPAYLPTRLAEFYERASRVETLNNEYGSVSIIGAVSPPGGDFSEPVTQHTKRFIRCFWGLSKELANARHYPSIGWIHSYSEYIDEVSGWWEEQNSEWRNYRDNAMEILNRENRLQQIVKLVGPEALPDSQKIILKSAEMLKNAFMQQNAFDEVDMYAAPGKQLKMLDIIMNFYNRTKDMIAKGIPLVKINKIKSIPQIMRMRFSVENDKLIKFDDIKTKLHEELDELERKSQ